LSYSYHEVNLNPKVSASRRDDEDLFDNIGRRTKDQLGIFHVKVAGSRCIVNEHWGKANSKSPWSLWRVNTLLGRKAISAGWQAKQLPPFHPTWELMLQITLPANILDAFRIYCPCETLEGWTEELTDRQSISDIALKIQQELCSARRVAKLRRLPAHKRDVPLENIILFNRDTLILRELQSAIKRGDIGSVLNVLAHWMVTFRGSGKMPKYADALFRLITEFKTMNPKLRSVLIVANM
jgi:hypothetical protein